MLFKRKRTYTQPCGKRYFTTFSALLREPAVLIAGATGSGKSVILEHLIRTLMVTRFPLPNHPEGAVFWLADPKRVQLGEYKSTPFCRNGGRYADSLEGIEDMMKDLVVIMDYRLSDMQRRGIKDWDGGNIYLLIDELADLMISAGRETTKTLTKLLQLCRAAGIHVIMCTQCPNRKVISAPIQCNITSAVGLKCKTAIESRQIIGISGCEDLPKHGTVYVTIGTDIMTMNVPMIDREEVGEIIDFWNKQG